MFAVFDFDLQTFVQIILFTWVLFVLFSESWQQLQDGEEEKTENKDIM